MVIVTTGFFVNLSVCLCVCLEGSLFPSTKFNQLSDLSLSLSFLTIMYFTYHLLPPKRVFQQMKSEIKVTPLLLPSFLPSIRLSIQLLMQQKNEMYKCKREPFQLENCYLVETWMRERERERKRLCEKKSSIGPMGGLSTSGRRRRRPSNFGFEPFASLKLPIRDST